MQAKDIIELLKQKANTTHLAGMQRFGIDVTHAIGVNVPELRKLAKSIKKNHPLALELWDTGLHEARILASMIDDAALVTEQQIDSWTKDFNSWDLCDQVCGNLFDRTPFAIPKAIEFSTYDQEFIKRASFVLMAEFAVHNKNAPDKTFTALMPIIEREAWDNRNFVKKAVNWALRQIGKRNDTLKARAIKTAENILKQNHKSAKWIASNALKELRAK
ncbi:DNA alkylation repair protein [Mucilaginibacter sp. SP1R1]|uniref:DNA alkylation repair protein n=1 Tax=Mucilaginibacter sp. SP1R1 TaxID=2723091 RepID=UPI0016170C91|nr:DNA alkylation repair protein [Mucilaginibacter sp. SP1R1]MBB6147712.1 3-methyladenine DNA glycosylase AlkD [Mucilaginibacter sp. SP1R1]